MSPLQTQHFVPAKAFMTTGVGVAKEKLTSFEEALRDAGIAKYNLVRVSSIFPPKCEIVSREEGIELLRPGQILFCVLAEMATNEPGRRIASSIGLALPKDREHYGYISEVHMNGRTNEKAGEYAEDLAASMLATVLGEDFDPDEAWDARKEQWMLGGKIVGTQNFSAAAQGPDDGKWVTTVASAVFCG